MDHRDRRYVRRSVSLDPQKRSRPSQQLEPFPATAPESPHTHATSRPMTSSFRGPPLSPGGRYHRPYTSSGALSDGGAILDMKRLLSKPAAPSLSGASSTVSSPSDCERLPQRQLVAMALARPPVTHHELPVRSPAYYNRPSVLPIASSSSPNAHDNRSSKPRTLQKRRTLDLASDPQSPSLNVDYPSTSSSHSPVTPLSALTPAAAVVEAYKSSQQRRDVLATAASSLDRPSTARASSSGNKSRDADDELAPYYTVFGTPDRFADGEERCKSDKRAPQRSPYTCKVSVSSPAPPPHRRSLSRKISIGKLRKTRTDAEDSDPGSDGGHRISDRRHKSSPEKRKNMSVSLERGHHRQHTATNTNWQSTMKVETPSKTSRKPLTDDEGVGVGYRFKQLVKRISSGALREKRERELLASASPPPVPELPESFRGRPSVSPHSAEHSRKVSQVLGLDTTTLSSRHDADALTSDAFSRFVASRPSLSVSRSGRPTPPLATSPATSSPRPSPRESESSHSIPVPVSASSSARQKSQPRRSTTSSSSPFSSSITSSRSFFQPDAPSSVLSSSSSSSSYAEESRTTNIMGLAKPIMALNELYQRLGADDCSLRIPSDPHSPVLPPPPRRQKSRSFQNDQADRPESPMFPSFNVDNSVNVFAPSKKSMDVQIAVVAPATPLPSRPQRDPRRLTTQPASRSLTAPAASLRATNSDDGHSPSVSSRGSTARPGSRKAATGGELPAQFRSMGEISPHSGKLSEREKAEKWDDLLVRSARAGGTLHATASPHLISDAKPPIW